MAVVLVASFPLQPEPRDLSGAFRAAPDAGEDNQPRCFSTWAPIALAGIGKLPATLADRSIEVKLKRKTTSEPAQRLDRHAHGALGEVARKVARWALDHRATVEGAEPALPGALDDRASDNWRPLLALANTAGGKWPGRASSVALWRVRPM
jgi:putative DNA primase/helicase